MTRDEIIAKLAEVLKEDTDVDISKLTEEVSVREGLGLDSVDLVGVVMRIEEAYKIRLAHQDLEKVSIVKDLIDLIMQKASTPSA